jgi:hypothetical protein
VKEVKGDSPEGIGAKRRPLISEGVYPLSSFVVPVHRNNRINKIVSETMDTFN